MSQYSEGPTIPDTAAGAIGQHLRVITTGALALAGAGETELGTMESAAVAAGPATIRTRVAGGTCKMIASAAIALNGNVFAAAAGKVGPVGAVRLGTAREASTADGDVIEVLRFGGIGIASPVVATPLSGAIAVAQSTIMLTKAGVNAMTLAAPTAAQEGLVITIVSQTANAHTVTATGLIDNGITGGSKNLATFAAFAGASITLMASNLKWAVIASNVVTVS